VRQFHREVGVLYWLRQAGVVLVIGLAVAAFGNVRATPGQLSSLYEDWWPHRAALQREWRSEHAGETVLPARVQAMLALLRDNRVESFRYSDAIAHDADTSVVQRIAESAYPIRVRREAQSLLLLPTDALDPRCRVVARRQEVVLAHCS
jgi:hypothetical protein